MTLTPDRHHRFAVETGTPEQRARAWNSVMRGSGRVEIALDRLARFTGEIRSYALGNALVTRSASHSYRLVRDAAMVEGIARDRLFVDFVESGRFVGRLAGRRILVEPGGVLVTRLRVPMDVEIEDATWYAFLAPMAALRRNMTWRPALDAKVFAPGSAPAVLIGHHLRALMDLPGDLSAAAADRVGAQTLRFLVPHLGGTAEETLAEPSTPDELLWAIRRFIGERLTDPGLDASMICREFALSRSNLYRLFSGTDGVSGLIRRLRLLGIHREIASGASGNRPLSEIAAHWGMMDDRTFRRAFIAQFGTAPSLVRQRVRSMEGLRADSEAKTVTQIDRWFQT